MMTREEHIKSLADDVRECHRRYKAADDAAYVRACRKRYEAAGHQMSTDIERAGPSWDAFCASYRIVSITDDAHNDRRYHVLSCSGQTYTAEICDRRWNGYGLGPAMYLSCTCAAYGGRCRHRSAVYEMMTNEALQDEQYDRVDWLERIEMR